MRWLSPALVAVCVVTCAGAAPAVAGAAPPRLAVTAFQAEGDAPSLIDASRAAITTVGVDGLLVAANGTSVSAPDTADGTQLVHAHHDRLRGELLVSNFSNAIGDFSEPIAYRLLAVPAHVRAVAAALAADVRRRGWDGICLDLESLLPRDRAGLTSLSRTLRADLPARATLAIAVTAFTQPTDYAANGYDLHGIVASVNRVELMTYDEHGPWENQPGPIGALAWQSAGVRAALAFVPRGKLDLGVAGYGYAWRPHSNDQLTDTRARALAGRYARFDATVGEWTATLPDGSVLWWSDARSYRLRVALAGKLGLHGLAMWDLGDADRLPA